MMIDLAIYTVALIVCVYLAYRAGDFMGFMRGSWGPEATRRLAAAREDSFQSGMRAATRHQRETAE